MFNKSIWVQGEVKARLYLESKGYKIIDKNCKIGGSELDIVCIYPKNKQKIHLLEELKYKKKNGGFINKNEYKFYKRILKNNIRELQDILVFIEVKSRGSKKFGEPYEAVGEVKKHNIARGCAAYIKKHSMENMQVRIDVVSVIDDEIHHIENAFDVNLY